MATVVLVSGMTTLTFAGLVISTWSTYKTCILAWNAQQRVKQKVNGTVGSQITPESPGSRSGTSSLPRAGSLSVTSFRRDMVVKKSHTGTMAVTVISSVCFSMTLLCSFVSYTMFTVESAKQSDWTHPNNLFKSDSIYIVLVIMELFQIAGLVFLMITSFNRLRMAFANTQHKPSDGAIRACQWGMAVFLLTGLIAMCIYPWSILLAVILSIPAMISFVSICAWTTFKFSRNTLAIAKGIQSIELANSDIKPEHVHSERIDFENGNNNAKNEKVRRLLSTSIRLTLCTGISLFSTMLLFVFFLIGDGLGIAVLNWAYFVALPFDLMLNNVLLSFTFIENYPNYIRCLGPLHRYLEYKLCSDS